MFQLFFCFSRCWKGNAHAAVARIADAQLNDDQKSWFREALGTWESEESFLVKSSTWGDDIIASGLSNMMYWHYSNTPFSSQSFAGKPLPKGFNIADVVDETFRMLLNESTKSKWSVNFGIRNLLNLVADIHQPIHNILFYSIEFPNGDDNGKEFKVACSGKSENLFEIWDSGAFSYVYDGVDSSKYKAFYSNVSRIMDEYPKSAFSDGELTLFNPQNWSDISHKIAADVAYSVALNGKVNEEYLMKARSECERMVALAGYRLSNMLVKIYNAKKKMSFTDAVPMRASTICAIALAASITLILVTFKVIGCIRKRREKKLHDEIE